MTDIVKHLIILDSRRWKRS